MLKWAVAPALVLILSGCANAPEDRVVGVWRGEIQESIVPPIPVPGFEREIQSFMRAALLKLRSDKTFVLALGQGPTVSGKWTLTGDQVKLVPQKGQLPRQFGEVPESLSGTFTQDYSRLRVEQPLPPFGSFTIVFRKTG